jgi:hypothetical protein
MGVACSPTPAVREANHPTAVPFDQLAVSGNACGPAALLNAYRCGSPAWQRALAGVPGTSDRERLRNTIRCWGLRPSASLPGRKRWTRDGINAEDLRDLANDLAAPRVLPALRCETFLTNTGESSRQLLARVHRRLSASLAKGLPPVISIRRIALRHRPGGTPEWVVLQGHFVTVTALPGRLEPAAGGFSISYLDPWGGRRQSGRLALSNRAFVVAPELGSPCLEADFPHAGVGKDRARPGEMTLLTLAAGIGRW